MYESGSSYSSADQTARTWASTPAQRSAGGALRQIRIDRLIATEAHRGIVRDGHEIPLRPIDHACHGWIARLDEGREPDPVLIGVHPFIDR